MWACIYAHNYSGVYQCMNTCMYVWVYICVNGCMYVCMYVCMFVCANGCMYTWMYICMYLYMRVCMCDLCCCMNNVVYTEVRSQVGFSTGAIIPFFYESFAVWYDMIWYDTIWYDMIWYMMLCDVILYYMIYQFTSSATFIIS